MDWIGVVLNLFGWWLMPRKRMVAMAVFLIGNGVWLTWSLSHEVWSIALIQLCYVALNTRTVWYWRQERKPA